MSRIAALTGETARVSTIVDGRRVTGYEAERPQPLRLITGVGRPYSLFSGATGRALFSMLTPDRARQLLAEHARGDADVEADAEAAVARIDAARLRGCAISRAEWIAGGCGVAVPLGVQGSVVAALSMNRAHQHQTGARKKGPPAHDAGARAGRQGPFQSGDPSPAAAQGIAVTVPERRDQADDRRRRGALGGRPPVFDRARYRDRNVVERCFARLKQSRAISTRYDELADSYRAGVVPVHQDPYASLNPRTTLGATVREVVHVHRTVPRDRTAAVPSNCSATSDSPPNSPTAIRTNSPADSASGPPSPSPSPSNPASSSATRSSPPSTSASRARSSTSRTSAARATSASSSSPTK